MSLASVITQVLATAEKLKSGGSANEANTRALLIDPVLVALGWNLADLNEVDREFSVFDGTFLDYALSLNGEPRLFVEAKAIGKSLSDPKFVSQTVNYANNEGVVWCVLTNGLSYRVYKTNEPVAMDKKLLFAVDLADADEGRINDVVASLQRISRPAVATSQLDEWGERLFTDIRVRSALQQLAAAPPDALIELIESVVAKPVPSHDRLRASLQRILDVAPPPAAKVPAPVTSAPPVQPGATGVPNKPARAVYDMAHHIANKPAVVADLFEVIDEFTRSLDDAVVRKIAKMTVNYFAGKRAFCSLKAYGSKAVVFIALDPSTTVSLNPQAMRDVSGVGHHGNGDVEYSLTGRDQLPEIKQLIQQAFARAA